MGLHTVTNVTDSAVQKNNSGHLLHAQERINSDFRGQEVSLVSTPLIPQKANKRLILNTNVSLDHKAHALDTWIQNPNTLRTLIPFSLYYITWHTQDYKVTFIHYSQKYQNSQASRFFGGQGALGSGKQGQFHM